MKVTVDTRHDSLDEALATVRAAFGANEGSSNIGHQRNTPDVVGADVSKANGASSAGRASSTPVATSTVAKRATRAARPSGRNRIKPAGSMAPTSATAPAGRAEAIRSWAKSQGMEVKRAGRLPAAVIQAYQESSQG